MLRALESSTTVAVVVVVAVAAGRGHRDAQLARLFAPRCAALSSLEGSAGCRAGRRGGSAAARADSPGRSRAPIGSRWTNLWSRLALQGGVASTPGAATETLGPRLAASTKRAGGRSAARPRRAPPCGPPPLRPRSRPKTPLERRFPPFPAPLRPDMCRGNRFSFFKMAWVISTVRGFRRHAPASPVPSSGLTGQVSLSPA